MLPPPLNEPLYSMHTGSLGVVRLFLTSPKPGYKVSKLLLCVYHLHLPKDHTSDLLLNLACVMTSGAAHLMGNLVPSEAVYSSSMTNLARPKSATFIACLSPTRQFRAAWRYEHKYTAGGNGVGAKIGVLCKLYTKL